MSLPTILFYKTDNPDSSRSTHISHLDGGVSCRTIPTLTVSELHRSRAKVQEADSVLNLASIFCSCRYRWSTAPENLLRAAPFASRTQKSGAATEPPMSEAPWGPQPVNQWLSIRHCSWRAGQCQTDSWGSSQCKQDSSVWHAPMRTWNWNGRIVSHRLAHNLILKS